MVALLIVSCATEAARLRSSAKEEAAPFSELTSLLQKKVEEHDVMRGAPELKARLETFKEAIHFSAGQARRSSMKMANKMSATAAVEKAHTARKARKGDEAAGHKFEKLSTTQNCAKEDLISSFGPANVKSKDTCIEACVKQQGCTTIAYATNSKKCYLYEACVEADRVEIPVDDPDTRKNEAGEAQELWGVLNGDGAPGGFTCGALKAYPNAKPAAARDAGDSMHNSLVFIAGDAVPFECEKGFTADGTKDGETEFEVECSDKGYFKTPKICVAASECGKAPCIAHAHPTGQVSGKAKNPTLEYTCDAGYSLNGVAAREGAVVEDGFKKNALFKVECGFDGTFKVPPSPMYGDIECKAFGFMPASQMVAIYNKVFQALFTASCSKELMKWAKKKEEVPPKLDDGSVCSALEDSEADCKSLTSDLKSLFDGDPAEFDANDFCTGMWDLLSMDVPEPNAFC